MNGLSFVAVIVSLLLINVPPREPLPPQVLTLSRDYSFDETAVLAKEHEQEMIRAALARELAGLVMRRLTALQP